MEINPYLIYGAIFGFIVGFLFASISNKFFKWVFIIVIVGASIYLYYFLKNL